MTVQQREQLREVLIDYLQLLTSDNSLYNRAANDKKTAQIRLLLKEVA